jgi:hypothetical protein
MWPSATQEKTFIKPERPVRFPLKKLFQNFLLTITFLRLDKELPEKFHFSGIRGF